MALYYTTTQDLVDHLGDKLYSRLTNRDGTGEGDDSIAEKLLIAAESVIHRWIGSRYQCPVDVSSDTVLAQTLKTCAMDVAPFLGHAHAIRKDIPKNWEKVYRDTMAWLKAVSLGEVVLAGAMAPQASGGSLTSEAVGPDRVITSDTIEDL